jgi:hypothetical protein
MPKYGENLNKDREKARNGTRGAAKATEVEETAHSHKLPRRSKQQHAVQHTRACGGERNEQQQQTKRFASKHKELALKFRPQEARARAT